MATQILGVSCFYHDAAACLVRDGEIIAAASEERFTRKKQDSDFPLNAVRYCLEEGGIEMSELDYVGFYDKPFIKFERILETYLAVAPRGIKSWVLAIPLWLKEKLVMRMSMHNLFPEFEGEVVFSEHHDARSTWGVRSYPFPSS